MRLFVALPLPAETRDALAGWMSRCGAQPGLRWTPVEQLHITLHFLGEVAESRLDSIMQALDGIAARRFRVTFEGVESLGRGGVLAVSATATPPFLALVEAVRSRLAPFTDGGPGADRAFHPHITVARARRGAAVPKPRSLPPLPALEFLATGFRLYRSDLRPEGALHTVIRDWTLGRSREAI
jgi:RNA 2',3'-cyclic 3'-phosphodiesterase